MKDIVTGGCDICKRMFSAKNKAGLARSIGIHKRAAHGIAGMPGQVRYWVYQKGMTPEQAAAHVAKLKGMDTPEADKTVAREQRKAEYQRQYRQSHKQSKVSQQNGNDAVPALLDRCCVCGARFYVVKGI